MHRLEKLRELSKLYKRWHSLEKFIDRIELVYESDLESAIANSNTLIETILKTILYERVKEYQEDESKLKSIKLRKLVSETMKQIQISNSDKQSNFISGLITAIQNLGDIRNDFSHGRSLYSKYEEKTENLSAVFLLGSVETIACFLINFYEIEYPLKGKKKGENYDYDDQRYESFNDWLDDQYGSVIVTDIPIMTSIALYTDPIAYQEKYKEYLAQNEEAD
jgi:hypothetical protein